MSLRVILRFTLFQDRSSATRNTIAGDLKGIGLKNTGTGLWEGEVENEKRAAQVMGQVVTRLADPSWGSASLDHVWLYIDRLPDDPAP